VARPFDLEKGPLPACRLLRLGAEEHVLLLTLHPHCIRCLVRWASSHKNSRSCTTRSQKNDPSPLPELPIQYADFAVWQRQWLQGGVLDEQLSYWKRQLGSGLAGLELPTDRARPAVQTYHGARHQILLPRKLAGALANLSRREQVTLFVTLLAAFKVLLHRHTAPGGHRGGIPDRQSQPK